MEANDWYFVGNMFIVGGFFLWMYQTMSGVASSVCFLALALGLVGAVCYLSGIQEGFGLR